MCYVFWLMLIIFPFASGTEDEFWREEIEKRLSVVEEFNINLKKENEDLKALAMDTHHENRRLQRELKELSKRVSNCEGSIHLRKNEDAKRPPRQITASADRAKNESGILYREGNQPVPRIVPPDSYPVSAVAFYGYLSQSTAHNLSPHHTIVYDAVLTNKGNGYNKGDGIFIAPVTGVYAFHFSVCVIFGQESPWASLEITQNGSILGSIFEEGSNNGNGYHCSSTLVISDVTLGDHIFIRTQEATRGEIFSGARGRTSFSGWLLFR